MSVDDFLGIIITWQVAGLSLSLIVGLLCYYVSRIFTGVTSINIEM